MTLDEIRVQIDETDKKVRALFEKRMGLVSLIAKVKAETSDRIFKPEREKSVIAKQSAGIPADLLLPYEGFLRASMRVSREYQYGKLLHLKTGEEKAGDPGDALTAVFSVPADHLYVLLGMIRDFGYSVKKCHIEDENREGDGTSYVRVRIGLEKMDGYAADTAKAMVYALSSESEDFQLVQ